MSPRHASAWLLALAAGLWLAAPAPALEPAAGSPGAWLKNGMDARAMGLGGAFTAVGGEASAAYWNPAALATVGRPSLMAAYTAFPGTGEYSQLAFALPLGVFAYPSDALAGGLTAGSAGTLAVSILRFAAGYDIEARRVDSLNPNYLFSDVEGSYALAWGFPCGGGWHAGLGLKGLTHLLDQTRASGWGADGGVLWTDGSGWSAALTVRDAYTRLQWGSGYTELFPPTARLGAAYVWRPWPRQTVLFTGDLEQSLTRRPLRARAGIEVGFGGVLFVRGGYADGPLAAGAGLRWPETGWGRLGLQLDYALVQDPIENWDHWVTLKLEF